MGTTAAKVERGFERSFFPGDGGALLDLSNFGGIIFRAVGIFFFFLDYFSKKDEKVEEEELLLLLLLERKICVILAPLRIGKEILDWKIFAKKEELLK